VAVDLESESVVGLGLDAAVVDGVVGVGTCVTVEEDVVSDGGGSGVPVDFPVVLVGEGSVKVVVMVTAGCLSVVKLTMEDVTLSSPEDTVTFLGINWRLAN
jgi:hypothetical protein